MDRSLVPEDITGAIEGYHWDFEPGLFNDSGIVIVDEPNLYMRKSESGGNVYTNKVVRSVFSKTDLPHQIDRVFAFFGDQPFSWWIGPRSRPEGLEQALLDRGMKVMDEYVGLAARLDEVHLEGRAGSVRIAEVRPGDRDLLWEHVRVGAWIWGYSDEAAMRRAFEERMAYLNHPGRRGGYVVALDGDRGIGNAQYRRSADGRFLYLNGAAVLPEYRRRGVYTELLRHRLNVARERGCQWVTVQARVGHSEPILRRFGFREFSRYTVLARTGRIA